VLKNDKRFIFSAADYLHGLQPQPATQTVLGDG
jgi:hypothetical protein